MHLCSQEEIQKQDFLKLSERWLEHHLEQAKHKYLTSSSQNAATLLFSLLSQAFSQEKVGLTDFQISVFHQEKRNTLLCFYQKIPAKIRKSDEGLQRQKKQSMVNKLEYFGQEKENKLTKKKKMYTS